jgi:hypothetical protein
MLREFLLRDRGNRDIGTKDDRARRRGALIDGKDVSGHEVFFPEM